MKNKRYNFHLLFGFLLLAFFSCSEQSQTETPKSAPQTDNIPTSTSTKTTSKNKKKIIFFGDSLTFGYGLKNPSKGFVGILQQKLDSLGLDYQAVNSGVSGETSSGGDARIDWVLDQYEPEVFILELGANDGLRGIDPKETDKNLQSIFDKVKAKYPNTKLVLTGMLAPPNMGKDFTKAFANIFPNLAKKNNASLVPFLLEGVAGIPELNQKDKIHPTEEGHLILADNVWMVLEKIL